MTNQNKRRGIFFTSDWHIGDANVLIYDQRPFKDLDHMHRVLINNYNSTVGPDDTCFFLGDIGLGKGDLLASTIQKLNGTKICILGNHDKGAESMRRAGFDVVLNGASLVVAGKLMTMTHCPLRGVWREDVQGMKGSQEGENWHKEFKHLDFSIPDFGQFHLSGHIHSHPNKIGKSTKTHKRQYDVGVSANAFRPVSLSIIESWIAVTLNKERDWRIIEEYPDYKINSFGTVMSFKRDSNGIKKLSFIDKDGYERVNLRVNNKAKNAPVHRLVAKAFIPNPDNLPQVNHKNGIKLNNVPENLEWCSNLDNQRHAWNSDLKTVKLTTLQVLEIREALFNGISNTELANKYNVDQSSISNIKTNRTWKNIK